VISAVAGLLPSTGFVQSNELSRAGNVVRVKVRDVARASANTVLLDELVCDSMIFRTPPQVAGFRA